MAAPTRAIVIVLDSVGIGALPDAAAYGDEGSDTLGHIASAVPLAIPTLRALGLGRVAALGAPPPSPTREASADMPTAVGRMAEALARLERLVGLKR